MDGLVQDLRYAMRNLRASPGFTAVAVLTLALAIGANTAVFSILNAIVLRPVAARAPQELVAISVADARYHQPAYIYADTFAAFRAQQHAFSELSMYSGGGLFRVEAQGTAADGGVEAVMPEYFDLLGVRAAAGRLLTDDDQSLTGVQIPVVVLTDRFRRQLFGATGNAVGETIRVNGTPLTIIGVTEPRFAGLQSDSGADFFISVSVLRGISGDPTRPVRALNVIGRLAPGVSLQQARAEVQARWPAIQAGTVPPSLSDSEQRTLRSLSVDVASVAAGFSTFRRQYGMALSVVGGLTAVLLAVGCVNLAGLLLARAMRRRHETAVRLALGAGPGRIVQLILMESVLLVSAGLVVAWPLAWWATRALGAMVSVARITPWLYPLTPDRRVLFVSTVVSLATGVLIAVLPAWRAVRAPLDDALRPGRTIAGGIGRTGFALLVGQVALSMVLAVGAGLFIQSVQHLRANTAPYRHRAVLWTRIWRQPGDRAMLNGAYWLELLRQLGTIRGVDAVAASYYFPSYLGLVGGMQTDIYSQAVDPSLSVPALTEVVSPGFFELFGIGRLRGRDFWWEDDEHAPAVAILNETAARQLFAAGQIVGQHLHVTERGKLTDVELVGVVVDAPIGTIRAPHQPVIFRPLLQQVTRASVPNVHVRVTGDMSHVRTEYIRIIESQGHHFVRGVVTLDGWLDYAVLQERLLAGVTSYAALLAVLLGCVGINGLLAYSVTIRVRELGVRLALGASRTAVVRMVIRDGVVIVLLGTMLGVPCALAAGRMAGSQLYELAPNNVPTLVGAAALFLLTGIVAALLPAMRAARVDPMTALRAE